MSALTTAPAVSARMRQVRRENTVPEKEVRSILSELGARYRICVSCLPGRPDIVNRSRRWAVFVHGCFWHAHGGCRFAKLPKSNSEFWANKLLSNRRRDASKTKALRALGFHVLVVWQCELRDRRRLGHRIRRFLQNGGLDVAEHAQ